MSRNSWKVIAYLAIGGFVIYSLIVISLGLSDENNVSGLHGQVHTLLVVWIVLGAGGLLYFLGGRLGLSLHGFLRRQRGSLLRTRPPVLGSIHPLYSTPVSSYETGIKSCSTCSRTFKPNIAVLEMGKETIVMYCDACDYTVCERCNTSSWDEFKFTPCPRCGQRLWRREGMLPI